MTQPRRVLRLGRHRPPKVIIAYRKFVVAEVLNRVASHLDPARAAAESQFGGLIASGLHTLSIYQRLWVNSRTQPWRVIAGATMSDVAFLRPVRPGDVLTGHTVIDDVRFEPDKHRGRVTFAGALGNQDDKLVLRVTTAVYLGARTA